MNRNEENKNTSRIPEESASKPMDSKRDVERSPDEKTDEDFPGYPHYPAKEDVMNVESGSHRVDADVEGMAAGSNASGLNERYAKGGQQADASSAGEGEDNNLAETDSNSDEIGLPQNVSNEDLEGEDRKG